MIFTRDEMISTRHFLTRKIIAESSHFRQKSLFMLTHALFYIYILNYTTITKPKPNDVQNV